jgi:hypothetical protein
VPLTATATGVVVYLSSREPETVSSLGDESGTVKVVTASGPRTVTETGAGARVVAVAAGVAAAGRTAAAPASVGGTGSATLTGTPGPAGGS